VTSERGQNDWIFYSISFIYLVVYLFVCLFVCSVGERRESGRGVDVCGQPAQGEGTLESRLPRAQLLAQRQGLPGRLRVRYQPTLVRADSVA